MAFDMNIYEIHTLIFIIQMELELFFLNLIVNFKMKLYL